MQDKLADKERSVRSVEGVLVFNKYCLTVFFITTGIPVQSSINTSLTFVDKVCQTVKVVGWAYNNRSSFLIGIGIYKAKQSLQRQVLEGLYIVYTVYLFRHNKL